MSDTTKAQAARQAAALDKQYRFAHGVDTFRGMIESGRYASAEAATVPKIIYSRRKFNRMNHAEQADYERRLAETKTEYRLYYADAPQCFTVVPKMVFDWYRERPTEKARLKREAAIAAAVAASLETTKGS